MGENIIIEGKVILLRMNLGDLRIAIYRSGDQKLKGKGMQHFRKIFF